MNKFLNKYNEMSNSVKASLWFMICSVFQKGISFITVPIFTRLLTTDEYGIYSIFMSWESILSIFVTLNLSYQVFNNGMVKYKNDKDGYASSMVGLTLVSSLVFFIIYLVFNKIWYEFTNISYIYMLLMFSDMIFVAILGLWTVRERYDYRYKLLVLITLFSSIFNPLLGIIFVLKFKEKVMGRLLAMIITNMIVGLIALIILKARGKKIIETSYWKYALKLDIPLLPHYLAMVVLNSSDRIMIGDICGSSFTAFYSIAYNAAMIMQIFINSINSSFNPWIYQKLENKKYKEIKNVSTTLIILIGLISIIPMFFGPEIIMILGSREYMSAVYVMSIISASVFMIYVYSLFINIELFFEKSKLVMIGSVITMLINIILNAIFIRVFGFIAAGYTTLISYIILAIFHYIFMKKIIKNNNIKEIYDVKVIALISIFLIIFSIVIQLLYKYFVIRYLLLLVLLIITCFNYKRIKNIISIVKNK